LSILDSTMNDVNASTTVVTNKENTNVFKRKSGDVGWEYGRLVDPNNKDKVRCNFYGHESTGGIFRFKQHIAQNASTVLKCTKAKQEAKEACLKAMEKNAKKKEDKATHERKLRDDVIVSSGQQDEEMTCVGSSEPHKLGPMDKWARTIDPKLSSSAALHQQKLNKALWEERTLQVQQYVARWVYTHAVPFNAIDNDEFKQMCEAIGQFAPGFIPPTQYDLREPMLKSEYARTKSLLKDRDDEKMRNGCSIMTDAWTDMKRRSIMNLAHIVLREQASLSQMTHQMCHTQVRSSST
ncbi:unnamed protein product, partial [Linum tenue]